MKSLKFFLIFITIFQTLRAQDKVLVFYKTNGFEHRSIDDGIDMITDLGNTNGLWSTDSSENSNVFSASNLSNYKVVIWCNTSGNGLLTNAEQAAFEDYIASGGGFVGIHAATDTYRDRSWPFYNDLVGAIVQSDGRSFPNHTSSNHNNTMDIVDAHSDHQSVAFFNEEPWNKIEEYYYWKSGGGQLYEGNNNLLMVRETGNNDFDEARPMSWFKEFAGGRSFYTALGHNDSDYSDDQNFIKHVEEGIKWAGNFENTAPFEQLIENGDYYIQDSDLLYALQTDSDSNDAYSNDRDYSDEAQIWNFEHTFNNMYKIQNNSTSWFLETPNAVCEDGANVATWRSSNDDHHMFKVIAAGDQFILEPGHCSGTALSAVRNGGTRNAEIKNVNPNNSQQLWQIVSTNDVTLSATDLSEGIEDVIIAYPNPTSDFLNFNFSEELKGEVLNIYDITGTLILTKSIPDSTDVIDLNVFPTGIYFVTLNFGNSSIKIIKN